MILASKYNINKRMFPFLEKTIIASVLLLIYTCNCLGQCVIKGCIKNSDGAPIVNSSVFLTYDKNAFVCETSSDSIGYFAFQGLQPGNYVVKVNAEDYKEKSKKIMLFRNKTMTVDFVLDSSVIQLKEVDVVGQGIIVNGDTTKIITRRYTTGQEQTLGDVLEVLPGVKVDKENSTISVNGKNVSRILMEKQDLFQGNNSVPLNNVPGQDITSIDVIDNYSDYNILEGFKTSNETVISVNLKKNRKNRLSGQADMQYGFDNKYIIKDYSLMIKKKMMLSTIVSANNTGKALMTNKDLVGINGGYNELLSGDDPQEKIKKIVSENTSLIGDREDAYKRNNSIVSLNSVIMPSSKLKILWNCLVGLDHYKMNRTTSYSYLYVPLKYDVYSFSENDSKNLNSNVKISFMPSKSFNIFYTGKIVWMQSNTDDRGRINSYFVNSSDNRNINFENTILAIKKIGKRNTLNISASCNVIRKKSEYFFSSDSSFYYGYKNLDDTYDYDNMMKSQNGGAECFVLCRINDNYYTRIGLRSVVEEESLLTSLEQNSENTDFNNNDYIRHYDNGLDIQFRRDRGKLQFAAKAKMAYLKFETNVSRNLSRMGKLILAPSFDIKYSFNNFHAISLTYKDIINTHGINNLLSNMAIDNYRHIYGSSVNSTFGYNHSANLIHSLMKPLYGFTLINVISYTYSADDLTNNYLLNSIIRESQFMAISSGSNSLMITSSIDKKFRRIPLDMMVNLGYNHAYNPYFMEQNIIRSKSNLYRVYGSISTFYKKGFNIKLTGQYSHIDMKGDNRKSSVESRNYSAQVSYTFNKFYTYIQSRYRNVSIEGSCNDNFYFDFSVRYNVSKALALNISGKDIMHVKSNTFTDATLNSYYSAISNIRYMPGYVLFGLSIQY